MWIEPPSSPRLPSVSSLATWRRRFAIAWVLAVVTLAADGYGEDHQADARQLLSEARTAGASNDTKTAIAKLDRAISLQPKLAEAYYWRGRERFKAADFAGSVKDFDQYVRLQPAAKPRQWERGIACYYAGQFAAGALQFKLYQDFDGNDVENSVWRYLCLAKSDSVEVARKTMLPIQHDRRIPMMDIFDLYRGQVTPDQVWQAVKADQPDQQTLGYRMFYARLYLGLYFESIGKPKEAEQYIIAAYEKHRTTKGINRFMWHVARIHAERLRQAKRRPGSQHEQASTSRR